MENAGEAATLQAGIVGSGHNTFPGETFHSRTVEVIDERRVFSAGAAGPLGNSIELCGPFHIL